ncbi:hypothetical protein CBR_g55164 [Chara braunii]|uniref:Aquaporin n=1 Tax=Chara braunii TaxID=69332 RepID=A0A388MCX5_CHABU|nr:hypothetical protein CBR_g55164 [Chara braunii]|eukprot:GBG92319.1 hypothetical protein CBR_g55164 [Chara braunii]
MPLGATLAEWFCPNARIGEMSESLQSTEAWRGALAEFLATFFFVYLGCGGVVASGAVEDEKLDAERLLTIAFAHGIAIVILVASTGAISGGHINPAVTLSIVLAGKVNLLRGIMYWVMQFLGAVCGAQVLKFVTPPAWQGNLGSHGLAQGVDGFAGLVMEIVLTFVLVFVVFATAVDTRGPVATAPLAIGFTVLVLHIVGVPYTGASMNPARSFGPAMVTGTWKAHWVYWFGPLIGATLAFWVYMGIFIHSGPLIGGALASWVYARVFVPMGSALNPMEVMNLSPRQQPQFNRVPVDDVGIVGIEAATMSPQKSMQFQRLRNEDGETSLQ